eukprot:7258283-Alexandrium_andersonii.AAC.1
MPFYVFKRSRRGGHAQHYDMLCQDEPAGAAITVADRGRIISAAVPEWGCRSCKAALGWAETSLGV